MTADLTELPAELVAKPLALIGISGLDTINNAVHKTIWDAFGNNRRLDRAPVHFKLLPNDHKFPVIKPKRSSYEWYIPKGILKKNWLNKHLNLIPAVIVIFYDVDWNDPQWNEKVIGCASKVQSIRAITSMHFPKIAVVVIQNTVPFPHLEDNVSDERAQALCAACEIPSKSLFVLPYGDHLMGYVIRLENAFYDLAQQYYHHEIRTIKSHKEYLNKTCHQYLFVRHEFKIGFINELKQDFVASQKHYLNAFNNLVEVRVIDSNANEVKTVAGYINYKLCNLLFNLNQPREAIAQFKTFKERYFSKIGIEELLFEHYAWMMKQYCIFGDLFNNAIKNGLPAIQTQHPGFYYQQAAQCAIERRESCHILCNESLTYPQPDPLNGAVEYYGQYIWRVGKSSNDLSDPLKEKDGIKALQFNELHNINHSMLIISLLGNAITQFKTYHCPRMRRHLLIQMAHEYYVCADYGKALTLYSHMLCDYRKEKWWSIVSLIIKKALVCAYLTASFSDYVSLAIEALGKNVENVGDKSKILHNLLTLIKNEIPQLELDMSETVASNAVENWKSVLKSEMKKINIDMSLIMSCIEVKARFTENKFEINSSVVVEVFIRILVSAPFQLEEISVFINNCEFVVCDKSDKQSLLFADNKIKKYVCKFTPQLQDVGKKMQISAVLLKLGDPLIRQVVLKFDQVEKSSVELYSQIFNFRSNPKHFTNFYNIQTLPVTHIIPRESKMSVLIEYENPALLGEWFPIVINVVNDEDTDAHHIQLSLNLISADMHTLEPNAELCFNIGDEKSQLPLLLPIGTLNTGSEFKKVFYLKANKIMSATVLLKITYDITIVNQKKDKTPNRQINEYDETNTENKKMACFKEHAIKVTVVKPFDITYKYVTADFNQTNDYFSEELLIIMPQIKFLSPWPIIIEDSILEMSEYFEKIDNDSVSCLEGIIINENMLVNEAICIKLKSNPPNQTANLGLYTVRWKRKSTELLTSTSAIISAPNIIQNWLKVDAILPSNGYLSSPLPFKLKIHSKSIYPVFLNIQVDPSNGFIFAGHERRIVNILPYSDNEFMYNFYPLICGSVMLPHFRVTLVESSDATGEDQSNGNVQLFIDRNIPQQIFIMPPLNSGKT